MKRIQKVVLIKGHKWAIMSCKLLYILFKEATELDMKVQKYPQKKYYFPGDERQSLIEKRNMALNSALNEISLWNQICGAELASVPSELRPWQDNCKSAVAAIQQFLTLELEALNAGVYKAN